jgi:peptide/nickel transport system permease protein
MKALVVAIAKHPSARIGAVIILVYVIAAVLGAVGLTPHDPIQQFRIDRLKGPTADYLMGTDLFGRDIASRLMRGIGQSFVIAFGAVAVATIAGTIVGLFAAWFGGLWDGALMRAMDVLLAFPAILLACSSSPSPDRGQRRVSRRSQSSTRRSLRVSCAVRR